MNSWNRYQQYRRRVVVVLLGLVAVVMAVASPFGSWGVLIHGWDRTLLATTGPGAVSKNEVALVARVHHQPRVVNGLPPGMVLGYFYDPGNAPGAVAMLQHYLSVLTGIIPFWYQIAPDGSISGSTDPSVLKLAEQHNLWTFALVQNMAGQSVFGPLLNSPVARERAIENMLTLVESNGYDGINLDWEGIAPSERHAFTTFVQALAQTFHAHGYYVTLSLPAETANQPGNSWTGAYNYAALGKAADLIMVMAYDEHYAGGNPGPIASPSWVKQVLNFTIGQVNPAKVILGIPGYGYNWSGSGPASALTYSQAEALANRYGKSGSSNHFVYMQNGQVHSVWFEDTQSLLSKIGLVSGYELRGIALWRLGIEDPKLWYFLQ